MNLSDFLDISDFFNAKITNVKSKGVDLTLEGKGLGKLEGGIIVKINPNKEYIFIILTPKMLNFFYEKFPRLEYKEN